MHAVFVEKTEYQSLFGSLHVYERCYWDNTRDFAILTSVVVTILSVSINVRSRPRYCIAFPNISLKTETTFG